jgi:FG-GAP-like repeat/Dockerin type I domain
MCPYQRPRPVLSGSGTLAFSAMVMIACYAMSAKPSAANDWVQMQDETSTRFLAFPICVGGDNDGLPCDGNTCPGGGDCEPFGANDPHEKDFAWGDLNQDGFIDFVVARKIESNVNPGDGGKQRNLLMMNEGGVLVDRTHEYASASTDGTRGFLDLTDDRDVFIADLNGDRWLDIVTAVTYSQSSPKTISHPRIYINQQNDDDGNWQGLLYVEDLFPQLIMTPNFCGVAAGDLDNDGDADLYFADYNNTLEDRLLINDGSGRFTDETTSRVNSFLTDSAFSTHAIIADMNGDGLNDIVKVSALGPYGIRVGYNDPDNIGDFRSLTDEPVSGSTYFVSVDDLNNDSRMDLIVVDDGSDPYRLNQGNDGSGRAMFSGGSLPNSSGIGGNSIIADLDGDGFKDVFVGDFDVDFGGCSDYMRVYRNSATPPNVTFIEESPQIWTPSGIHDMAVFDIDNDGRNDLIIGTCAGMELWMNKTVIVNFDYPNGVPSVVTPGEVNDVIVRVNTVDGEPEPDGSKQFVSIDGGPFVESPLVLLGDDEYRVRLPAVDCPSMLQFYVSVQADNGATFIDPPDAPEESYLVLATVSTDLTLDQPFESPTPGWTVQSEDLDNGAWERVDPVGTTSGGVAAQPEFDAGDGDDTMCYVTQQHDEVMGGGAGQSDVDGGPTMLVSPELDLEGRDALITFDYWHFSNPVGQGNVDRFAIDITSGGQWQNVAMVPPTGSEWTTMQFRVGAFVTPSSTVQVRFAVSDNPNNSITESGVDNFQVLELSCTDDAAPEIVHGMPGVSFDDHAFSGFIDPRRESTDSASLDQGINQVVIGFSEPVVDLGGTELTTDAFTTTETGGATAPSIVNLEMVNDRTVRLTLSRIITLQEWITIQADVQDLAGNPIANLGNLGAGADEPDRMDIGFLPANVNQDNSITPFDLLVYRQFINEIPDTVQGAQSDYLDTRRDGNVSPLDLLAFRQLVNGTSPSTRNWAGESMNNTRP